MENFSHSRQPNRAAAFSKKIYGNAGGFAPAKTLYDDVYGGPPKFGVSTLSPRMEDYSEIFGSFHASRASSIPVLDLPAVDESEVFFDVRSSGFDYEEVFGGFNGLDFAVSYEDLVDQSRSGYGDSSDEAWSPADFESLSGESVISGKDQRFSNGGPHHAFDRSTEFNVSYHKVSLSNEDISNGMTHVTQLQAVPGYTFMVDSSLQQTKHEEPSLQMLDDSDISMDFGMEMQKANHPQNTKSHPSNGSASGWASENDLRPQGGFERSHSSLTKNFVSVAEISLRTQPSELPPPSRPPPIVLEGKKGDSSKLVSQSDNLASEGSSGSGSPPFFDVEVDASSSAAASAAAIKEAMEKAQAKLRSAKESMAKRRESSQSSFRSGSKKDKKEKEGRASEIIEESNKVKLERLKGTCAQEDHGKSFLVGEENQKVRKTAFEFLELEEDNLFNAAEKQVKEKPDRDSWSSKGSWKMDEANEWKEATEFFELVTADESKKAFEEANSRKILLQKVQIQEREQEKAAMESFKVQSENDRKVKALREDHKVEYHENKQKGAKEPCGHFDNNVKLNVAREKKIKVSQKVYELQENDDSFAMAKQLEETKRQIGGDKPVKKKEIKLKVEQAAKQRKNEQELMQADTQIEIDDKLKQFHEIVDNEKRHKENEIKTEEASERPENEEKVLKVLEQEENEKKLREAIEMLENEKGVKEALARQEYEKRLKQPLEREKTKKKQKDASEREENEKLWEEALELEEYEKRHKEIRERKENEKLLKSAYDKEEAGEENEKKLKEAVEKLENEKGLKEAPARQEFEKGLKQPLEREKTKKKQKDASEREENEKLWEEALELEEYEKRHKEIRERKENEKLLKSAYDKEEVRKSFKVKKQGDGKRRFNEAEEEERRKQETHSIFKETGIQEKTKKVLQDADDWKEKRGENKAFKGVKKDETSKVVKLAKETQVPREGDNISLSDDVDKLDCSTNSHSAKISCDQNENKEKVKTPAEIIAPVENRDIGTEPRSHGRQPYEVEIENVPVDRSSKASSIAEEDLVHEADQFKSEDDKESLPLDGRVTSGDIKAKPKTSEKDSGVFGMENVLVGEKLKAFSRTEDDQVKKAEETESYAEKIKSCHQSGFVSENQEKESRHYRKEREDLNQANVTLNGERKKENIMPTQPVKEFFEDKRKTEGSLPVTADEKQKTQKSAQQFNVSQSTGKKEKNVDEPHATGGIETERMKRERELEKERLRKIEEEREREREREKDRMAVDLATLEARERVFAESRERAERAALERATAEARQRAMAEARERLERACAEAREKSLAGKAAMEARIRAERAAVERATAEARERAAEKVMAERAAFEARERVQRSVSDKFSSSSRNGGMRQSSSSSDLQDPQFQSIGVSRYQHSSVYSERCEEVEVESAQRSRARLERYRRTAERAAKALAEKNMRDLLAQREQAERNRLAETLDADVRRWSSGKEGNLRALLSTLQYILGPDSGWQPIPLTEVITSAAVKKAYRKATLCVHPDKLQQRGASIQQKYICEKVFDLLKEAWNKFNSEER